EVLEPSGDLRSLAAGEQARGLAVEAVGDVPFLALGLALAQHRGEGVVEVAGGGMHGKACWLVDDEDVLVLVGDAEIPLADGLGIAPAPQAEGQSGPDRRGRLELPRPLPDEVLADDPLDAGAGEAADLLGEIAVESPARVVGLDAERDLVDLRLAFLLHGALLNRSAWCARPLPSL